MKKAFTLIEILLVLSISVTMMALSFFVYKKISDDIALSQYQDITNQLTFAIKDMDSTYDMAGGKSKDEYDKILHDGGLFYFNNDPKNSLIYPFLSDNFKKKYISNNSVPSMVDIGFLPTPDGKYRYLGVMFPLAADPKLQKICPQFLSKYSKTMLIGGAIQSGLVKNPTINDINKICDNNSYEIYIAERSMKFKTPD